ncbi:MotA/TolQ/ExbB proton channel family protein [Luteolibacter pohnpeiensis]|uniref:MotA/TolQ/ExbB proton channel family protein n=1 Tax=Luteolibacter pohnpeiensis TaxID=454153 RepID=A0A934S6Q1_9BACT|nr:MotA/TolQ/ExbB proton channel family protein [Luteolibacter pohnpeiensis]MBK1881806.1 MotA/TolQ/ExbB proton channel family protein [Luteolibacter pohnpeiensis]
MFEILALAPKSNALTDFFFKSGPFIYPLILTSVAGVMAVIYKYLSLAPSRIIPPSLSRSLASFPESAKNNDAALREIQAGQSTLARLAAVTIKHRGKPREEIIQAVEAASREENVRLHSGIGVLDIVITVAPLLGLLGTASGLVTIFRGLGETNDNSRIALGIAEALYTTIFGLAIAVPCVIAHGYFLRKIEILTARLEILLSDLVSACQRKNPHA